MIPFSKRNLIVLFALFFCSTCIQAQQLHLSDLQSLYSADSASFGNFCRTNGFEKEVRVLSYNHSYSMTCEAIGNKAELSLSFARDTGTQSRPTYVLNYFLGKDQERYDQLKEEITRSGFKFKEHRTANPPGDYTIGADIYNKDLDVIELQTHTKDGSLFGYDLAFSRTLTKR